MAGMDPIAQRLTGWRKTLLSGVGRFPVSLIALAVFAVLANLEIAGLYVLGDDVLFRIAALSGASATIAAAAILFGERHNFHLIARHAVSLAAALAVAAAIWFWKPLGVTPPALLVACSGYSYRALCRLGPSGVLDFCLAADLCGDAGSCRGRHLLRRRLRDPRQRGLSLRPFGR